MACIVMIAVLMILFLQHIPCSLGSSHWIVTEDGRIQSQADTVFNMKRPYDLVAFMRQDDRVTMLDNLKDELLARKDEIDKNEDRDPGLEQRFYKTDPDCLAAGKPLPEFDLYISTVLPLENKGIKPEEHIDLNQEPPFHTPPDCTLFTELEYSVHGFEHLENKTSWVLYNMAAFYWRIKGDPYHVIECVRRALHFSPRLQKDVALISLANVLHRARYSNEAAIVVHAALDVLAEYNKSVICFENTLKIQPDFEAAAKRKHAVLCHAKLENALEEQHKSLQQTLNDLKDYQRKHDHWQQQKEKLNAEQVHDDARRSQHIAYDQYKMREAAIAMDEHCHLDYKDGKQVLTCTWEKKSQTVEMDFTQDNAPSPPLESEEESAKEKRSTIDYNKPVRTPTFARKKIDVPKYVQRENDWPLKDECDTYVKKVPDPRNLSTIYLSPENKGFDVKPLLTEAQGLKPGGEHPLPWYPPVCVTLMDLPEGDRKTYDHIHSVSREQRAKMPLKLNDPSMRQPSSHFFYGNLLWATKNYTGAVKHYEKSLEQHPENNDVFNTLRALKCYQKYHQATQSVVKETSSSTNCPQRPTKNGPETESRVICKTENGEEKCVIETRSRGKAEDCNGHCTQTCTVTPIKFDSCTGDIEALAQAAAQSETQNSAKGSGGSNGEESLFAGGDISSKLDELSEQYLKKNLCQGEECAQLRLQQGGQKPHIKLDFVNGVLHQKLIFVQSPNDLPVEPHECVIFNDGSKSSGCNRPEYHAYVSMSYRIHNIKLSVGRYHV
ncbi:hypothetical protein KUTeg_023275 [Tegillarca granosa]|uniref:Tetratricopeptide repeat protein 17 n=1 Tax=Tegillarca granosa TaxID=220873 RepID=A0ABQ9E6X4_TEGGR|nr:hypothetical protein KUTeg_023275 [Tegillarca granosa]